MDTEIVGTIEFNPTDDRILTYTIDPDTLPENTLDAVNSVINPQIKGPKDVAGDVEHGLPAPAIGQRYLLVERIGKDTAVWNGVQANANDIIQCVSVDNQGVGTWTVVFDSQDELTVQFVTNLTSQVQYRYADGVWMKSYEGWYEEGDYSIVI
jgi:hypothetical protein